MTHANDQGDGSNRKPKSNSGGLAPSAPPRPPTEPPPVRAPSAVSYELEFVPAWASPVADALLRLLPRDLLESLRAVLIAQARTGYLAARLSSALSASAKLMVVDTSKDMIEQARKRLQPAPQGVFYSVQSLQKLSYAEHVFDAVFCDHALLTRGDLRLAGRELVRVLKPDGWLAVAIPFADTLRCFPDILLETAQRRGMLDVAKGVQGFLGVLPTPDTLDEAFHEAGLRVHGVERVTFSVTFQDAEALLFSPFVEHLYLPRWMATCNHDAQREVLFFDALHALNTYFAGVPLEVEMSIACVVARRLGVEP
jgi:SAM-dependent methyltransferase